MPYSTEKLREIFDKAWDDEEGNKLDAAGNIIEFPTWRSSYRNWDVDHIIPRKLGGSNHIDNLQPLKKSTNNFWRSRLKGKPGFKRSIFNNPNCWANGEVPYKNGDFKFYLTTAFSKKKEVKKYVSSLSGRVKKLLKGKLTGIKEYDQMTIKRYRRQYSQVL